MDFESTLPRACGSRIGPARSTDDFAKARDLIADYATSLGVDLCFQDLARELEQLPKMYGRPSGVLFLAMVDEAPAGCVGVRRINVGDCEMKRLYVQPDARGNGIARRLVGCAIGAARKMGYARMLLDTLENMTEARSLYRSVGFGEIPAYYPNPLPGVRYMALDLKEGPISG